MTEAVTLDDFSARRWAVQRAQHALVGHSHAGQDADAVIRYASKILAYVTSDSAEQR